MTRISVFTLIRTDTTLDLSQKAEKGTGSMSVGGPPAPRRGPQHRKPRRFRHRLRFQAKVGLNRSYGQHFSSEDSQHQSKLVGWSRPVQAPTSSSRATHRTPTRPPCSSRSHPRFREAHFSRGAARSALPRGTLFAGRRASATSPSRPRPALLECPRSSPSVTGPP